MSSRRRLEDHEIETALAKLEGWELVKDRSAISRQFTFPNFITAFGFMSKCALVAEKMDHHPEWFNVYRTVDVILATHDADGVTLLDIELAAAMNKLA